MAESKMAYALIPKARRGRSLSRRIPNFTHFDDNSALIGISVLKSYSITQIYFYVNADSKLIIAKQLFSFAIYAKW